MILKNHVIQNNKLIHTTYHSVVLCDLPNLHGARADSIQIEASELHEAFDLHGLQKVCGYLYRQVFNKYKP